MVAIDVSFFLWGIAGLLIVAVAAVALGRATAASNLVYSATFVLSAAMLVMLAFHLISAPGTVLKTTLPIGLPWIGASFKLDSLSALFLGVVNFGGAMASLYGLGYGRHEEAPHRVLPFFTAFLAGMNLVVLADDAFAFLLSWEFMSLASWALVVSHHRSEASLRAGFIYLVMASFGTLSLLLAFGLLAGSAGDYGFDTIRAMPHGPLVVAIVFILMLLGAGSKAGLVPLHVWLPLAHPAAPSHVSALMSGVMTKVAIYGFIRVCVRPSGGTRLVVERGAGHARRYHCGARHPLRADGNGPEAVCLPVRPSRTSASSSSASGWRWPSAPVEWAWRRPWPSPRPCFTSSITRCSRACCSSGQGR